MAANNGIVFRDAYLRWVMSTAFDVFRRRAEGREDDVGLIVEWKDIDSALAGWASLQAAKVFVPAVYTARKRRIGAFSVPRAKLAQVLDEIHTTARRVELASPVGFSSDLLERFGRARRSQGPVFTAVLDDGCAFANSRFASGYGTRVVWLWDQGEQRTVGRALDPGAGPTAEADFGYGRQWAKEDLDRLRAKSGGDESSAYEALRSTRLRRRAVHGTHVLDLFAGGKDWEIAFVQFPASGVDDPSGRWLARNVLDGLGYVLECAGPNTRQVVVNVSWGPQTGPHDGTSVLETAIDELVAEQCALGKALVVCLPTGNSYGARAHGCVDAALGGTVAWEVPPDGETPAFLEIWWPPGVLPADALVSIAPPGERPRCFVSGAEEIGDGRWYANLQQPPGQGAMVLLVVHPTGGERLGAARGPAGRWTIHFDPGAPVSNGSIHLYVARADHNMGARRRAKASVLDDAALGNARFRRAADRDAEAPGSSVRRAGTLNGMGTGRGTRLASGYSFQRFEPASYASSGPPRGGGKVPDAACATDRSQLRQGVIAAGVRSGTRAVLVGTSTASPQLARQFAEGELALFEPFPPAEECRDREQRIWPDDALTRPA